MSCSWPSSHIACKSITADIAEDCNRGRTRYLRFVVGGFAVESTNLKNQTSNNTWLRCDYRAQRPHRLAPAAAGVGHLAEQDLRERGEVAVLQRAAYAAELCRELGEKL